MSTPAQMRMERIERLLKELEYEVTRGIMENEINEHITWRFVIPRSRMIKNGVVECRFETVPNYAAFVDKGLKRPMLKLIDNSEG